MDNAVRRRIWKVASSYYPQQDWAHGRNHVERVLKTALKLGKLEQADPEIIELAAILHDIFENKETHGGTEGFRHEIEGSKEARRILSQFGFAGETVDGVCHCIESHRKRTGRIEPQTIEAKCLFDADKLDCIGAIGILRSAFISFDHHQEIYKEEKDIEAYRRKNIRPDRTIIDYSQHSSNLEYQLSLKSIANIMYTATGKRLARERAAFVAEFYDRLAKEMQGIE